MLCTSIYNQSIVLLRVSYIYAELTNFQVPAESTYMNHFKEKPLPVKQSSTLDEGENEQEKYVMM
jgi:hypothetical protein